jgi:hypothetical protein
VTCIIDSVFFTSSRNKGVTIPNSSSAKATPLEAPPVPKIKALWWCGAKSGCNDFLKP